MYSGHAVPLPTGVTRAGVLPSPRLADPVAELSAAGRPVLLLLQGEKDMTFPAVLAGQAAARIPRATAVVLPEAGHMAHVDDPRAWMRALRSFLVTENDRPPGPRGMTRAHWLGRDAGRDVALSGPVTSRFTTVVTYAMITRPGAPQGPGSARPSSLDVRADRAGGMLPGPRRGAPEQARPVPDAARRRCGRCP